MGWRVRRGSLIFSEFPPLFKLFRAKLFNLLWRGSRDGFTAWELHRRSDVRANILTLITDRDSNVFGGFIPVEWDSDSRRKGSDSLRSFLFTPRNPHGVPPRNFALRAQEKQCVIFCYSQFGPCFGRASDRSDIGVNDDCDIQPSNSATTLTGVIAHARVTQPSLTFSQARRCSQ
jgi:hypothetical protein